MEQTQFLELLLDEFYDTRLKRNAFLSDEMSRPIRFLDELSIAERSRLIDELSERRRAARAEKEDDRG